MASSLSAVCRASARVASRRAAATRGLATSARCLAAHNFTMPALSPTMTEGNIAAWKVKDGQPFSAGDVLLEIETDKATMDVEAQDDGVMMKILSHDGSKSVQVGSRIAVVADAGDDVSALEMPADESPKQQQAAPEQQSSAPPTTTNRSESEPARAASRTSSSSDKKHEQKYPLMPAVEHLVKQHGLGPDDVATIAPTGPGGRLLKGDVLAFVGTINAEAPSTVSSRLEKLSHLDLSNIKVAPLKPAPAKGAGSREVAAPQPLRINVPVSLAKAVEVQRKIQETLGVFLPLSTFISRAAEVANDDLPLISRKPSSAELFVQILGLDKVKAAGSRGVYLPQISAIPHASMLAPPPQPRSRKAVDIIDELAGPSSRKSAPKKPAAPHVPGLSSGANVFTLVVPKEEEQRAQVFLERCKLILEEEPGRLVL
ncbi:biotin-requiring enzyme [Hirsutella rhossiliensis]|uniref:Biotin-requiring enzyme domain-containing protein n=1 Tax=Hirsutella rhossiliensis TaxID=111463 RepID=A0A9P8N4E8_9HYPO|nr:biotin-requiring enzyme domain-containing protein [Hirsutella rhossiliensis]KAH0966752.1 biotin-requiring enzyme domain-containing protein [Hirsutella rhossiliensis]